MLKLFRYSGSKTKFLPLLQRCPGTVRRVVEPYLGSGAFILNSKLPGVALECNPDVYSIWKSLGKTTPAELKDIRDLVQDRARKGKYDVRDLKLTDQGIVNYIRVNVTGLMMGQLSSWTVYPQWTLPIEKTIEALPRLKDIDVFLETDDKLLKHNYLQEGDLVFLDPPYIGTKGNYISKTSKSDLTQTYDPKTTVKIANTVQQTPNCHYIWTYGSNASETFSDFEWQVLKTVKVPNLRRGGTVERNEMVSYSWKNNRLNELIFDT